MHISVLLSGGGAEPKLQYSITSTVSIIIIEGIGGDKSCVGILIHDRRRGGSARALGVDAGCRVTCKNHCPGLSFAYVYSNPGRRNAVCLPLTDWRMITG
jgi:hypothetical protein